MKKLILSAVTLFLLCACTDDTSVSDSLIHRNLLDTSDDYSSSSSAEEDSTSFVEPPSYSCEEIVAIQVADSVGNTDWDYDYRISYLVFHDGDMLGFYRYNGNDNIYRKKASSDVWEVVPAFNSANTPPCHIGSVILGKGYKDNGYELCRSNDNGDTWSCSSADTTDFTLACDDAYFYYTREKNMVYSTDGIDWKPLSFASVSTEVNFGAIGHAFVADSLHCVYTSNSYLLCSKDLVTWDSTHVPVRQGANKVIYGNGTFVYAGAWSELMYSTDFKTWNKARIKCRSCGDPWYGDLAFENGIFFVVGSATSFSTTKIALASVNGKDFVEQSACGPADDYDNVFPDGNGNFYAMQGSTYSIFHPAQ